MKAIKLACAVAMLGACAVDAEDASEELATGEAVQAVTTDVWHATWNGSSANAQFWSPTGNGYVDVFEGRSGSTRYAYLNFSSWSFDPSSMQCFTWTDWWGYESTYCYYTKYTYAYGWGQIPAGDAQIAPNHAHVKTTLGSNFGGYQCTIDYSTWVFDCGTPAGGTVDIRWNKNGQYSVFQSGTTQQTFGPYTYKAQGSYRSASADASGSLLGIAFTGTYGYFGDTKGTSVTKSVIPTPNP